MNSTNWDWTPIRLNTDTSATTTTNVFRGFLSTPRRSIGRRVLDALSDWRSHVKPYRRKHGLSRGTIGRREHNTVSR